MDEDQAVPGPSKPTVVDAAVPVEFEDSDGIEYKIYKNPISPLLLHLSFFNSCI